MAKRKRDSAQLMERKQWFPAIQKIESDMKKSGYESITNLRKLSICYFELAKKHRAKGNLDEYKDSLRESHDILLKLEKLNDEDPQRLIDVSIELGQYEQVVDILDDPETILFLSEKILDGRNIQEIDIEERSSLQAVLDKAISLESCHKEAFILRLELSRNYSDNDTHSNLLYSTLKRFPGDKSILDEYLEILYNRNEVEDLINAVKIVKEHQEIPEWVIWHLSQIEFEQKKYEQANEYLEYLDDFESSHWCFKSLSGEVNQRNSDYDASVDGYRMAIDWLEKFAPDQDHEIIACTFSNAFAMGEGGNYKNAYTLFAEAAECWFKLFLAGNYLPANDHEYRIDGKKFHYSTIFRNVKKSSEWLINHSPEEEQNSLRGLIYFILFILNIEGDNYITDEKISDDTLYEYLEQSVKLFDHPVVHEYYANYLFCKSREGWLSSFKHYFEFWIWAVKEDRAFELNFPLLTNFTIDQSYCEDMHKLMKDYLSDENYYYDRELMEKLFLRLFLEYWSIRLYEFALGYEIVEISKLLLSKIPDNRTLKQKYVIGSSMIGLGQDEMDDIYKKYLADLPEDSIILSMYINFLIEKNDLISAYYLAEDLYNSNPDQEHKESLDKIKSAAYEGMEIEKILQKELKERWKYLENECKEILAIILRVGTFNDEHHIALTAESTVPEVKNCINQLTNWQIINEGCSNPKKIDCFRVGTIKYSIPNELIELILNYDQPLALIVSDTQDMDRQGANPIKKVFQSPNEFRLYCLLEKLFRKPDYLIMSNVSLAAMFDWDEMKSYLTEIEFNFYKVSSVDLCVVDRSTELPIIAFEVDSWLHDNQKRLPSDLTKNDIFSYGGLPLIRIRISDDVPDEEMREAILGKMSDLQVMNQLSLNINILN